MIESESMRQARHFRGRRLVFVVILGLFFLFSIAVVCKHYYQSKHTVKSPSKDQKISNQQIATADSKAYSASISSKDFESANNNCIMVSQDSLDSNNVNQAKSLILDCIKDIPSSSISWRVYRQLAYIDKKMSLVTEQKSDIQKAISLASADPSAADVDKQDLNDWLTGIK